MQRFASSYVVMRSSLRYRVLATTTLLFVFQIEKVLVFGCCDLGVPIDPHLIVSSQFVLRKVDDELNQVSTWMDSENLIDCDGFFCRRFEIEWLWVAKYSLAMVMSRNGVLSTNFAREATIVWNKVKMHFMEQKIRVTVDK